MVVKSSNTVQYKIIIMEYNEDATKWPSDEAKIYSECFMNL